MLQREVVHVVQEVLVLSFGLLERDGNEVVFHLGLVMLGLVAHLNVTF